MDENELTAQSPATDCIHAGAITDERSVVTPIYQTTTFRFDSLGELAANVRGDLALDMYTRHSHPNYRVVEARLAAMEHAEAAVCFASGMAAITTAVLTFCKPGDNIVCFRDIYGGTYKLLHDFLPSFGITTTFVPTGDFAALDSAVTSRTRLLYCETPTNPLSRIVELRRFANVGTNRDIPTIVDNTWATPINQQPIEHGIDLVIHSATKYLGGHSDVLGGLVAGSREHVAEIRETLRITGGIMDPAAAFLLERGMKTLGVRMIQHNRNAHAIAELAASHPAVAAVYYPGLSTHRDHTVAAKQMSGFGGMLAIDLRGGWDAADRFCRTMRIGVLAVSLGAVETLVSPPSLTSHAPLSAEERAAQGITDGTLRLSIGVEDTADLIADFTAALDAASV